MKVLDYEGLEHFKEKLLEQVSEMITASAPPDMDYVIETYVNEDNSSESDESWYRLWKSGWVEQGAYGSNYVTYLIPMKEGNEYYSVMMTRHGTPSMPPGVSERTTTGCRIRTSNYQGSAQNTDASIKVAGWSVYAEEN